MMNNTEEKLLKLTENILFRLVWICLGADCLFFAYRLLTRYSGTSSLIFFLIRLLLPFVVNLLAYLTSVLCGKLRISQKAKHRISSACMCTIGGSIAFFHGNLIPLLLAPGLTLIYCSIFRDRKQQNVLLIYCLALAAGACAFNAEWSSDMLFENIQTAVAVLFTIVVMSTLSSLTNRIFGESLNEQLDDFKKEQDRNKLMSFDSLTGLYSRTFLVSRIKNILSGESELGKNVDDMVLAAVDVDNFKSVNDTYGHENGDIVLRALGEVLGEVIEKGDLAGRYAGEEFVLLLTRSDYKKHLETLERLRETFMNKKYGFTKREITFSCGTAKCRIGDDFDEILSKADEALYKAKTAGKEKNKLVESIEPGTVPVSNYTQDGNPKV